MMTVSTLESLSARLHQDPEFRREYRRQKPYYDLILEIINRRKKLGITQKELAKRVGTTQSSISRVESGDHDVRLSTLIRIADALDSYVDIRLIACCDDLEKDYIRLLSGAAISGGKIDIKAEEFTPAF